MFCITISVPFLWSVVLLEKYRVRSTKDLLDDLNLIYLYIYLRNIPILDLFFQYVVTILSPLQPLRNFQKYIDRRLDLYSFSFLLRIFT